MFGGATFRDCLRPFESVTGETGRQFKVIIDNVKYHYAKLHAETEGAKAETHCVLKPLEKRLSVVSKRHHSSLRQQGHNAL